MTALVLGNASLYLGDCRDVMATFEADSVDSIVCDPPYGIGFMGNAWDHGVPGIEFWTAALRVAKPGAYLLAFGGTRMFHRLACAVEDAGWEFRDTIMWVYGSGFPKSKNLGDGRGTALKPAWEPIIMARKPLVGTVAANAEQFGTGVLNIDACRVGWPDGIAPEIGTPAWGGPAKKLTAVPGQDGETVERAVPNDLGRWPANIIHDGSDEVVAAFPMAAGQLADARTEGENKTRRIYGAMRYGRVDEPSADSENAGAVGFKMKPGARRLDSGSAARFFYCAKASRSDRGEGNTHPTVKPTELMRYLCRLVTPAGGRVLDPFAGSGSTGIAALHEGFRFSGIELSPDYAAIALTRLLTRATA